MHVVLLNQYYAPAEAATAEFLRDLGRHLVQAGHRVTAVCSRRCYADPRRVYAANEVIDGVSIRRTWTTGFGRGSRLGRSSDYLGFLLGASQALALERDADVVVSLTTPPLVSALGLAAARVRGARSVCWVMDVYPELAFRAGLLSRGSPLGRLLQAVARGTLHGSDRVIALGETMAERLLEDGARRVTVVHNWADGEAIRPRPVEGHELRRAWNWEDRFVVLYSGNMGLVHEFSTVLDAADRLREEERVRFAFVGDGPRRAWLETEVGRRRLGNVEFRPRVPRERLGQGLTAGDVHLVSMIDGIAGLVVPSKIYGILAAGRPTLYVGPPVGEVAAILREGGCGTHVAIDDGPALAAAVRGYLHDADRRIEEGRRARELFEARFTKRRGLEAHRRALESLTEGPG